MIQKFLSVCSGIEAASVAFEPLGWKPLAFSEIEPFPRAVLAHHYPDTPIHGDFTELKNQEFIIDADLLCGGTPCQAFSVAGLRKSLADDRGNLTLQFILLADAIDALRSTAGRQPAWILWENVPGVLNTPDNAFGAFLGGLCGRDAIPEPANGWTGAGVVDGPTRCAAWRTLDAQHFGLAQRRKRVFVLARGGAGRWAVADALLPIIESSRWHPAPSRETGERVAPTLEAGANRTGGTRPPGSTVDTADSLVAHTLRAEGHDASEDGTGRGVPLVPEWPAEIASTLDAHYGDKMGLENQHVNSGCPLFVPFKPPMLVRMREGKEGGGKGPLVSEDQSLTLATGNDQVLAVQGTLMGRGENSGPAGLGVSDGPSYTLTKTDTHGVMHGMQVRRLTPVECERLQGFPDGYTNIPWRGNPESPDGPRYKALGNSWAVPCAAWIGKQIHNLDK